MSHNLEIQPCNFKVNAQTLKRWDLISRLRNRSCVPRENCLNSSYECGGTHGAVTQQGRSLLVVPIERDIRKDTLLWPYAQHGDVPAIRAAAKAQAEAAVAEYEWIGDVQLGSMTPQKGNDDVIVVPFSYQVAKKEPGSSITRM